MEVNSQPHLWGKSPAVTIGEEAVVSQPVWTL
jgi:hypothetical protein